MTSVIFAKQSIAALALIWCLTGNLCAQEAASAGSEASPTVETQEQPDLGTSGDAGPVLPSSPDNQTPLFGHAFGLGAIPEDFLGRHLDISASVLGGYDDNVNFQPEGSPSWFTTPNGRLSYISANPRTNLLVDAAAGITYYFDSPGGRSYDPNLNVAAALSHRLTERLTLDLQSLIAYQSQPDLSSALSSTRRLGNFFRTMDKVTLAYRWTPRFSTHGSYTFSALEYESSANAPNRIESEIGIEGRYLLFPTTSVNGNYSVTFLTSSKTSGDAVSQRLSVGANQTFSLRLKANAQAGVQYRTSDQATRTSPYAEVSLDYQFAERATIQWNNRYSIEESDLVNAGGRKTFRTNLQARYAITGRLSTSLLFSFFHGENQTPRSGSSTQQGFDVGPLVSYALNKRYSMELGFRHIETERPVRGFSTSTDVSSSSTLSRNRYFAGVTVKF